MTNPLPNTTVRHDWLGYLCDFSAAVGAVLLLAIAFMTVISVIGRAFFMHPILGDVELVQISGAVVVASFLPYTQYRQANIIVDFFTTRASQRIQHGMDRLGVVFYTGVMSLVLWRVAVGGMDIYTSGERTMLMDLPLWWPYALMLPGLSLCVLIGLTQLVRMSVAQQGANT